MFDEVLSTHLKYISSAQEYVMHNFHLREVFHRNLNEAISLAEIDVSKRKVTIRRFAKFYLNVKITFQPGINDVNDNHDKFFLKFG